MEWFLQHVRELEMLDTYDHHFEEEKINWKNCRKLINSTYPKDKKFLRKVEEIGQLISLKTFSSKPNNLDWAMAKLISVWFFISEGLMLECRVKDVRKGTFSHPFMRLMKVEESGKRK